MKRLCDIVKITVAATSSESENHITHWNENVIPLLSAMKRKRVKGFGRQTTAAHVFPENSHNLLQFSKSQPHLGVLTISCCVGPGKMPLIEPGSVLAFGNWTSSFDPQPADSIILWHQQLIYGPILFFAGLWQQCQWGIWCGLRCILWVWWPSQWRGKENNSYLPISPYQGP